MTQTNYWSHKTTQGFQSWAGVSVALPLKQKKVDQRPGCNNFLGWKHFVLTCVSDIAGLPLPRATGKATMKHSVKYILAAETRPCIACAPSSIYHYFFTTGYHIDQKCGAVNACMSFRDCYCWIFGFCLPAFPYSFLFS